MKIKSSVLVLLIIAAFTETVFAQSSKTLHFSYITLDGIGLNSLPEQHEATSEISSVGGFISIKTTVLFNNTDHTSRTYFTSNNAINNHQKQNFPVNQVFLNIGDEYVVDILNRKTDALLQRYIIKRIKAIPEIKIELLGGDRSKQTLSVSVDSNIILTSPIKTLKLQKVTTAGLENLEVEYQLINLSTKKTVNSQLLNNTEQLHLKSNTEYELRYNYVLQPESTVVKYLKIKPYWYQSPLTYLFGLFIIVGILFFFITKRLKKKVSVSNAEQKKMEEAAIRLQSMLNPHFTFNALSTIQGLMNTGRIDEANQYLEDFGSLLRQSLSKNKTIFNSLDQELDMMRMYLGIESLRFNFKWEIEISPTLNTSEIEIPTLMLQPLIENAIKHGISSLKSAGKLWITCHVEADNLIIIIKDNGTWTNQKSISGYGLSITQKRIETINKIRKNQPIVLSFDKNEGTQVILTFHNWMNN